MNKIQYHYTNTAKQVFILTLTLYTLLRFAIMMEIIIFKLDGYYEATNIPLTLLMYAFFFAVLFCLFRGHKFCFTTYDDTTLTYHNTFLRKTKALDLRQVNTAVFDTMGVKFYFDEDTVATGKPDFFLPFFRSGIIEAIQIDKFYKKLKADENIRVAKTFKVLPGYTDKWKFVAIAYGFLAVITFMSCATPLTAVIVLLQSH